MSGVCSSKVAVLSGEAAFYCGGIVRSCTEVEESRIVVQAWKLIINRSVQDLHASRDSVEGGMSLRRAIDEFGYEIELVVL